MNYVDGYVLAVPTRNKAAYQKLAEAAAEVFRRHGALAVVENWGEDVPEGKLTSFPMAVKCAADETVVFSWITWPSRAVRDAGMKMAMEDLHVKFADDVPPFDGKRMIFGGFETIVDR